MLSVPWKVLWFHSQYGYIVEQQHFRWNVFVYRQGYAVSALKPKNVKLNLKES